MTDFHTHILPRMDDGSGSTDESLAMLRLEQRSGIHTVVLTPHFYAGQNSPDQFLKKREAAWERLSARLEPDMPVLRLGAEVQYFEGIANVSAIHDLCIEGTDLLLLEMPFFKWEERAIRTVLDMQSSGKQQIVLAHIERYLKMQPDAVWDALRRSGVYMQVNVSFFEGFWNKRKAMKMLEKQEFDLIGTDCHNLTTRKPAWDPVPEEAMHQLKNRTDACFKKHAAADRSVVIG